MGIPPTSSKVSSAQGPKTEASLSTEGPSIALKGSIPLSLAFHPSNDLLAISTISGEIRCYEYTGDTTKRQFSSKHHKDSVRCVRFSADGSHLYSCSVDKSIQVLDMNTKQVVVKKSKAHDRAVNTLLPLNEMLVASGDDSGQVRVWDLRAKSVVQQWQEHEDDTVTDLHWVSHKKSLISTGADGFLSVYDIRKPNVVARSDNMETELQCMVSVNGGTRMAVGQGDGAVSIWKWGWWGDMVDRFPGHPGSIDAMVALADDLVVTGSSDGIVRVLSVFPNKFLGVIGTHDEFPIENLSVSHDRQWLASSSHDMTVRMWNLSFLDDNDSSDDDLHPTDVDLRADIDNFEDENSPIDIVGLGEPLPEEPLVAVAYEDVDDDDLELEHALLVADAVPETVDHAAAFVASDDETEPVNIDSDSDQGETAQARKRKRKRQKQAFQEQKTKFVTGNSRSFFSGL